MSFEKRKIEEVTGGIIRSVIFDSNGNKIYKVECDDCYLKCEVIEKEVIIIEKYETEEQWH